MNEAMPFPEWFSWQRRRLFCGAAFIVFFSGGLVLSLTYFPLLSIACRDKEKRVKSARNAVGRSFRLFLAMLRFFGVADFRIKGREKLTALKGSVIVANHPSLLDVVYLLSVIPQTECLVKASLKKDFFLKGVISAADYIPNDEAENMAEDCLQRLKRGQNILIFPEGTRSVSGKLGKLQRGAAHLALRARAPVQIVRLRQSDPWLEKGMAWHEVPREKPEITAEVRETVNSADFAAPDAVSYGIAARHLTRYIAERLATPENA